jgi:uncharacterized phage protein (TIGR02218 family)
MKTTTEALADFLLTRQSFVRADLYSFTLPGGEVLRYASTDMAITAGGRSFGLGPLCQDAGVRSQRGVYVSTIEITFYADDRHTVDGAPFLNFLEDFGLDGASVTVERAVAASWADMASQGPVGTWIRFAGRVSGVQTLGRTQATVACASWLDLLSARLPADIYQSSCLNSLGDGRCGVALAGLGVAGQVTATATQTSLPTALIQPAGWFDLGKVVFSSGANAGLARTVKRFDAAANLVLVSPLPSPPAAGDAFTAYPGCDLSMTTCQGKFANLARFRGQPFVPAPTTGLPT